MKLGRSPWVWCGVATVLAAVTLLANRALAHCDGMDGPVVVAARKALDAGDVNLVLVWVKEADEDAIRTAFRETLEMRKLAPRAREFADRYFFETLVRVHRAGEGEPYTGLKPAGRDLGPAIPGADKALEVGNVEPLVELVTGATAAGIRERFQRAMRSKTYDPKDVHAGREHVEAYVDFLHYVEGCYAAAQGPAHAHDVHR